MSEDEDEWAWIRSRPKKIQDLMRRFPPSCKVQATRPLRVPGPGQIGVVMSYTEYDDGTVGVTVIDLRDWLEMPGGPGIRAACEPDWLAVVGYLGNMTTEWVDRVLAGEDIPAILED